jgi:ribonuclease BN (tRNA processing enzyme)
MRAMAPRRSGSAPTPVKIAFLGTADAFASGGRTQAGYVLQAGGRTFLLEAGPGILGALKREKLAPEALDFVLVSHLHGDHFAGLPFLFLEYVYETPRRRPLVIAGPRGLEQRTRKLARAMYPTLKPDRVGRVARFTILKPNRTVRLGNARVSAIRSPHTPRDVSLSLKLALGGKTVVFSGDTGWNEELVAFSRGADLMICECTYYAPQRDSEHIDYRMLRRNRERLKVGRLVLSHLGREVLNHAGEIDLELAFDGMRLEL